MVKVGPLESSDPTTLLKLGHLEKVAQDCVQMDFEGLKGGRLHYLSVHTVPVHSKSVFCSDGTTLLCFSLCPLPMVLSQGTTENTCLHLLCTLNSGISKHW